MVLLITASNWAPGMSPDENDSQNEPKPEKKYMGIDKGGPEHPDPEMKGGGQSQKDFFRPFGSEFGLQIRAPPGTSPGSATERFSGFKDRKGTTW